MSTRLRADDLSLTWRMRGSVRGRSERVSHSSTFGLEDAESSIRVEPVGTKTVYSFSGEADEEPVLNARGSLGDIFGSGGQEEGSACCWINIFHKSGEASREGPKSAYERIIFKHHMDSKIPSS